MIHCEITGVLSLSSRALRDYKYLFSHLFFNIGTAIKNEKFLNGTEKELMTLSSVTTGFRGNAMHVTRTHSRRMKSVTPFVIRTEANLVYFLNRRFPARGWP